jgi:hypothetical protein
MSFDNHTHPQTVKQYLFDMNSNLKDTYEDTEGVISSR